MIAIAVDDEILMLGALVSAVKVSPDISEVTQFSDCDAALEFVKENSVASGEGESVNQFFHILSSVAMPRGCVRTAGGEYEYTRYSSCCDTDRQIYYYTTYENRTVRRVEMHAANLDGELLVIVDG